MFNDRATYKNKMLDAKKNLESLPLESLERKVFSNEVARYHNLQLAKKIQLNSFYGALSNPYFRWFDFDMAEAITSSGQLTIQWAERYINEYMNTVMKTKSVDYIIASDTDSLYINMEPLVDLLGVKDPLKIVDALDKFCNTKVQNVIKKAFDELADYMHSYDKKMFMKRETIADKGIWKAAKMYILNAWNIEGVQFSEPQLKIQGIEAVRSSTPKVCRAHIKECISIIMNSEEETLHQFIAKFKTDFIKLPFEDVAFPRGMNGMNKYRDRNTIYSKGTPIHVKGALLYNNLIHKRGLDTKYQLIGDGDKIRFAYLKLPNPLMEHVISVPDDLPEELEFAKYIDYDTQFNKSFLDPIKAIVEIIGWDVEKRSTLESFF